MKISSILLFLFALLLFVAAWPPFEFAFASFICFVPLLLLGVAWHVKKKSSLTYFLLCFLFFLFFHIATAWYFVFYSVPGSAAVWLINALLMAFPFLFFYQSLKLNRLVISGAIFLFGWMSMELIHMYWPLHFPLFHLGNVFGSYQGIAGFFRLTGVAGGTYLVLLSNVLIFILLVNLTQRKRVSLIYFFGWMLFYFAHFQFGGMLNASVEKGKSQRINILALQPCIDPYWINPDKMKQKYFTSFMENVDTVPNETLVVLPETFLSPYIFRDTLKQIADHDYVRTIENSSIALLTGSYVESDKIEYQNAFNAAFFVKGKDFPYDFAADRYYKQRLVPGAEKMPFVSNEVNIKNGFLEKGHKLYNEGLPVGICFESLFGNLYLDKMKYNLNSEKNPDYLLFNITNDGWFNNTPLQKLHLNILKLRAIETASWMVRSSNCGISAVIDPSGKLMASEGAGDEGAVQFKVPLHQHLLFPNIRSLSKYIYWLSLIIFLSLLIYTRLIIKRK